MDMEALVLGLMNARLTEKALSSAASAERAGLCTPAAPSTAA